MAGIKLLTTRIFNWFQKEKSYLEHWFDIDERIRFALAGIVNMVLRYLFFAFLVLFFSEKKYQLLLFATWLISSVWAFYSYKYLVFQSSGSHFKEYLKSIAVWTVSYFINAALLAVWVGRLGGNVYLAQGGAVAVIVVINYLLFKHFAFKQPKPLTGWERFLRIFDVFSRSA